MPKWQTSPNTTPVKRFIRGHFYHIDFEHKPVTFLGRFESFAGKKYIMIEGVGTKQGYNHWQHTTVK